MAWRGNTVKPIVNTTYNPVSNGPEMSQSKKTETQDGTLRVKNRAFAMRRDKDKEKSPSINLIDIDSTILSYMDTVISPTVIDAGRQVKVPINYASPERWKAIRKDGYVRDKNGKIQTPVIAFRRTTMQRNDQLLTLNRYLQYPVVKKYSEKNKYDKFSLLSGFKKTKEIYSVAMPDHIIINYDFIVWTELVEQGNKIVESINFSTEDYWGDKNKFKFRTSISDYNFETAVEAEQDRIVKTTFTLMVYAYLLPEKYENYKATVQKAFTPRKIVFDSEMVGSMEDIEIATASKPKEIIESKVATGYSGLVQFANISAETDFAISASSALFAVSSSFIMEGIETGSLSLGGLNLTGQTGSAATSSFQTGVVSGVSSFEIIDSLPDTSAQAAIWLVSISDESNFKAVEIAAGWDITSVNYYATEVSQIGNVPVNMSVNNTNSNINLVATPLSGTWTVKFIKIKI
jgi:hypothetical protein